MGQIFGYLLFGNWRCEQEWQNFLKTGKRPPDLQKNVRAKKNKNHHPTHTHTQGGLKTPKWKRSICCFLWAPEKGFPPKKLVESRGLNGSELWFVTSQINHELVHAHPYCSASTAELCWLEQTWAFSISVGVVTWPVFSTVTETAHLLMIHVFLGFPPNTVYFPELITFGDVWSSVD